MALDVRERIINRSSGPLREAVRAVLGEPGAVLGEWDAVPLKGGFGALDVARSLFVLRGVARVGPAELLWSVVLKVLAPVAGQDDPAHIGYWKREMLLYQSGLLDDLPAGLRAPRCYVCDEPAVGIVWLWLEHVREDGERAWPPARWALAARHLGRFNGSYLAGRSLPHTPWLGGRRLRTWLERHGPLVARIAAAPFDPHVRRWWPRPVVAAILRLWEERDAFCAALERLPQTFCQGDVIRRNLLARRGADGSEETVGIDWEHAGHYAVGEEVGETLSVASAFYDVEPADLPALDEAVFAGYLAGLRDVGWRGDVPGLVTLVSRRGEVHVEAIGTKAVGSSDPIRRDSIVRISSMTKPITAAATMILVEECKLRLDDPVDRLLPELADRRVLKRLDGLLDDTVPTSRPITVRDLLTFRMGFGQMMAPPDAYPILKAASELQIGMGPPSPSTMPAPDEWIRRLGSLPLMHQPGEQWLYDTGSDALGILIARASGEALETFLRERIFEPLGMEDTSFSVPATKLDRLSTSYWTKRESGALEVYDEAAGGQWSRPPAFPSAARGSGLDHRRLPGVRPDDAEPGEACQRAHPVPAFGRDHDDRSADARAEGSVRFGPGLL